MSLSEKINLAKLSMATNSHRIELLEAVSQKGIEINYQDNALIKALYIDKIGYQEKDKKYIANYRYQLSTTELYVYAQNSEQPLQIQNDSFYYKGTVAFPLLALWPSENASFIEKEVIAASRKCISDFIDVTTKQENSRVCLETIAKNRGITL